MATGARKYLGNFVTWFPLLFGVILQEMPVQPICIERPKRVCAANAGTSKQGAC